MFHVTFMMNPIWPCLDPKEWRYGPFNLVSHMDNFLSLCSDNNDLAIDDVTCSVLPLVDMS